MIGTFGGFPCLILVSWVNSQTTFYENYTSVIAKIFYINYSEAK